MTFVMHSVITKSPSKKIELLQQANFKPYTLITQRIISQTENCIGTVFACAVIIAICQSCVVVNIKLRAGY